MSRSPTETFRNPRAPGRRRKPVDAPEGHGGNGQDYSGKPMPAAWWDAAYTTDKGKLIAELHNAVLTLDKDPLFAGLLAYDEMLRCAVTRRVVPDQENPRQPGRVDDYAIAGIQSRLQWWYPKLGVDVTLQAINTVAMKARFHPLRDWLKGLAWDEQPRLDMLLPAYFGADDTDPVASAYLTKVGPMFLMSMVARIFDPGCQADYMLVLEGSQGALKSSACQILAGEYFSDNLPKLHNGDRVRIAMHIRGKWLVEVAELASIDRAEATDLKEFLSQREEAFIPKYARVEVREPRQTIFVGTTNKTAYLRDETGGRRFWPVKCSDSIDIDALRRDREQLFAEAVDRYLRGEAYWPSPADEAQFFKPMQDARYQGDEAWDDLVRDYLDKPYAPAELGEPETWREVGQTHNDGPKTRTTLLLVARQALFIDKARIGTVEQRRITAIMERLGWIRGTRTAAGTPWVRPGSEPRPLPPRDQRRSGV